MDWTSFIYFAIPAVLLWGIGAYLAFVERSGLAYLFTLLGLLVFASYYCGHVGVA